MDKLSSIFKLLMTSFKCFLLSLIYKRLVFTSYFTSMYFPSFRVRKEGSIFLDKVKFRENCKVFADGGSIVISRNTFFNIGCSLSSQGFIKIGERCLFGENVKIYDHNHRFENGIASHFLFDIKSVEIGNNCWIGSNCIILPGVHICDGVTVGAGSVIAKDISEPGVYVSNSAKLRKVR